MTRPRPPGRRIVVSVIVLTLLVVGLAACQLPPSTPVLKVTLTPAQPRLGAPLVVSIVVAPDRAGGATPTGSLVFQPSGTRVPLVDGAYAAELVPRDVGPQSFAFQYSGDDRYTSVDGKVEATVDEAIYPFVGSGRTVGMLGDSITYLSSGSLDGTLAAGGYRRSVTGVLGYTTVLGRNLVDAYATANPDVFVLGLATNDLSDLAVGKGTTLADIEARVAEIVAEFPHACVVVSTVSAHRSAAWNPAFGAYNAAAASYNQWVRATFAHVVDWEAAVAAALASGSTILTDEVHPTSAGSAVLADLVRQAVDGCGAPAAPPA